MIYPTNTNHKKIGMTRMTTLLSHKVDFWTGTTTR